MFDIIIFDYDGTLVETKLGIMRCAAYALEKMGIPVADYEALNSFVGPPLFQQLHDFAGLEGEDLDLAVKYYRERYTEKGMYETRVFPGIPELLSALKAAGKTLAVATSKASFYAEKMLENDKLLSYFDLVVGCGLDGSGAAKTELLDKVFAGLPVGEEDKARTVMIGDRFYDIEGAKARGLRSIGVRWGSAEGTELEDHGAGWIVDDVPALKKLLLEELP